MTTSTLPNPFTSPTYSKAEGCFVIEASDLALSGFPSHIVVAGKTCRYVKSFTDREGDVLWADYTTPAGHMLRVFND